VLLTLAPYTKEDAWQLGGRPTVLSRKSGCVSPAPRRVRRSNPGYTWAQRVRGRVPLNAKMMDQISG